MLRVGVVACVSVLASSLAGAGAAPAGAQEEDWDPFEGVELPDELGERAGDQTDFDELPALGVGDEPVVEPAHAPGDFDRPPPLVADEEPDSGEASSDEDSEVLEDLTTPTREVLANEDGSVTENLSTLPVRFEDASGEWREIDLDLVDDGRGDLVTESSPAPVRLLAEEPGAVEVELPQGPVQVSAPDVVEGDLADPEAIGERATAEGEGGTSLEVAATPWGFEQFFEVPNARSPASYEVDLQLPAGLSARDGARGVEVVDGRGQLVGFFAGGLAQDSATEGVAEGAVADVVTSIAAARGSVVEVAVSVDEEWLADPERVYPVVVDPTFVSASAAADGGSDTWVLNNLGQPQWAHQELKVGSPDGTHIARAFLDFPLDITPYESTVVTDATLTLTPTSTCNAGDLRVYDLDQGFSSTTIWSNQPSATGQPTTAAECVDHDEDENTEDVAQLDVEAIVQDWYDGTDSYAEGLTIRAANETSQAQFRKYHSGDSADPPELSVTYNANFPTKPTLASPADEAQVPTLAPTLTANTATDPDGDDVDYWFRLWTGDEDRAASGQIIESGWVDDPTWTVPEGELVDGAVYRWAVSASDGVHIPKTSDPRELSVNLLLGTGNAAAQEQVGPVSVNLATGNVNMQLAGPSVASVGGGIGFSLNYDSQTPDPTGLTGKYINDTDEDGEVDIPGDDVLVAQRLDPTVSFDWGDESPHPGVDDDHFLARWRGLIDVPDSGAYRFGASHDGDMRIVIEDPPRADRPRPRPGRLDRPLRDGLGRQHRQPRSAGPLLDPRRPRRGHRRRPRHAPRAAAWRWRDHRPEQLVHP